ncbi:MAG: hypothetical protein L0229_04355, partial [Blastocatellia bacterium]|nr:hypothetical protein [Blastocatellia bacterium]
RRKKSLKKEKGRRTPHKRSSLEKFSFCPARSIYGLSEYGVAKDQEVYKIKRGMFEFYFIEENGKLKVLTLGFEM